MKTTIKILTAILFLVVLGGLLFWYLKGDTTYTFQPYTRNNLNLVADRSLTSDQIKEWEQKVKDTQAAITKFDIKTTAETRINTLFSLYAQQDFLGRYGEAKKALEEALAIEVSHNLLQVYASLLTKMGNPKAAIPYIDAAIRLAPQQPNLWRTKIDIERQVVGTNLASMEKTYINAILATQNDINMMTLYASYLAELGRKEDAIKYWEMAKKIYPTNVSIYEEEIETLRK